MWRPAALNKNADRFVLIVRREEILSASITTNRHWRPNVAVYRKNAARNSQSGVSKNPRRGDALTLSEPVRTAKGDKITSRCLQEANPETK